MAAPAVRFVGSKSDVWKIQIDNPKAVADAIGVEPLAAFYKCFVGVDRVVTLEHLLYLNEGFAKTEPDGRDSFAFERNLSVLIIMLAGTIYEVANALQDLQSTTVVKNLKDKSTWEPLNEMRKKWLNDPMATTVRNGIAFHLGERNDYVKGIENSPDPAILIEARTMKEKWSRFVAPWEALLFGVGIKPGAMSDFEEYVKRLRAAHTELPLKIYPFFNAVLSEHGIKILDELTA